MVAQKDIRRAADDVLLGASMRQVAHEFRERLIEDFGFRPEEVTQETSGMSKGEWREFMAVVDG